MKKGLFLIIMLLSFLINKNVYAESLTVSSSSLGGYYHALYSNGTYSKYGVMNHYQVASGTYKNTTVYCIAPAEEHSSTATYTNYAYNNESLTTYVNNTQNRSSNYLTSTQLSKISLYAYYGYGYPGHDDEDYIPATQMLIYQVMENQVFTNTNCYFGSCSKIEPSNITPLMEEIEELVANHYVVPSFNNETYTLNLGSTLTLEDTNGVLSNFSVSACSNCTASITGNKLTITPTSTGSFSISLAKSSVYSHDAMFLTSSASQNMVMAGNIDTVSATLSGTVTGGSLTIKKVDEDSGDAIDGAVYQVIDSSNNKICTITIKNGVGTCSNIPTGTYTVYEIEAPDGYLIDTEAYTFTINSNNTDITLNLTNKKVLGSITITKVGEEQVIKDNSITYEEIPLEGVVYELYDLDFNFITLTTTDESGYAYFTDLCLGSYYVIEASTVGNHIKDNYLYQVDLVYIDDTTPIVTEALDFKNYLATGSLAISKVSAETGNLLPDATLALYNLDDELIYTGTTNSDGFIYIDNLEVGSYYLVELESPYGYVLNSDPIYIDITYDNTTYIEVENELELVLVELLKLDNTNKPLEGVEFNLYNDTDEVIGTYLTNNEGYIRLYLAYGKYYFQETKTLDNYLLNDESIYFTIDDATTNISLTHYNTYIEPEQIIEVPSTGVSSSNAIITSILLFIISRKLKKRISD